MKKRNKAAALSYTKGDEAPIVIASGKNGAADRLLEIARQHDIEIIHDDILADILSDVTIGSCIPSETYAAVAAIFAFLEKGIKEDWF
ncbi:EscU/YscU/HrcU family type III secretion system export apparatus switch protein [Brucepastera parasyntrophica]|uniref:EscU/YscU/HrcU family type III secretion system export apparatus switch protein n=1 Tax=Brucepastera parasyntrophica TaxID=2880008 RepID=UPI00210EE0B7|nr:EscU/YscU/HrcU family type III secretion system export apparatus switch protein [Brucepastera parasyntrophica]ULQ59604.1 EscU/YscU/HrcU family type III secretion system export apparatus switch protein [Brucepastera parasyntrophica]